MKWFLWILAFSFVSAQEMPCASLLENLPSSSLQGISTLEATLTIRYLEYGEDEVQFYLAKDFEGNHTYHSFSEKLGNDFVTSAIYSYQNGVGTLTRGDETEEAPPEDRIKGIEEMMEFLELDMRSVFTRDSLQSCDGEKSYGGLLTGEQVTVRADGEEIFLLFDDTGQFFAHASYYSGGELVLGVLEEFVFEEGRIQRGKVSTYEIKEDEAVLLEERWLEAQYNQPVDESLLAPTE